jgi:dihydrofolate synthase / folylpolyglutamate synthase
MSPEEALDWIAGREILGMRLGLERMTALLRSLGNPERAAPALHVVGTNGKSSTARLAAAALGGGGARVGAYMSPHVIDWTERIQVDGEPLDAAAFAGAVSAVRAAAGSLALAEGDEVTQFEALTAAAFWTFREAGAAACVVEAGLGGRYDATNVLQPRAAVALTNIALDHTDFLGDTVEAIAAEKLAVCADGSDRLVVGRLTDRARVAVEAECARRGLRPLRYGLGVVARETSEGVDVTTPRAVYRNLPLQLAGRFQRDNLAVAVAGAEMLRGAPLDLPALAAAVAGVCMPGRLEVVDAVPPIVLDGAHNPAGVEALVASLPEVLAGRRPAVAVVSVLDDKDAGAMLKALAPVVDRILVTRSGHARAASAEDLAVLAAGLGIPARVVPGPVDALRAARLETGPDGVVLVTGSLYLLVDLRRYVLGEGAHPPC